jgi:hypothetical protein
MIARLLVNAAPLAIAIVGQANGATVTKYLDQIFSDGSTPPSTSAPWLEVVVSDTGFNTVRIDLICQNLGTGEYISEWYLNLNPTLDPSNLVFSAPTKTGTFDLTGLNTGADFHKVDGDGYYDIEVLFDSSSEDGGIHRFTIGDQVSYTVSYSGGVIDSSSFSFLSASSESYGPYFSAAHVNSTPDGGTGSGWLAAVPEPSAALSVLLGIGAWLGVVRKRD